VNATKAAYSSLANQSTAVDAIVAGCSVCESEQIRHRRSASSDEGDAQLLCVALLAGSASRTSLFGIGQHTRHTLLSGDGATDFAKMSVSPSVSPSVFPSVFPSVSPSASPSSSGYVSVAVFMLVSVSLRQVGVHGGYIADAPVSRDVRRVAECQLPAKLLPQLCKRDDKLSSVWSIIPLGE
jgi:hypothetical protein